MVTSNTETGITVTYQDSDGTLDFTVGTLPQLIVHGGSTLGVPCVQIQNTDLDQHAVSIDGQNTTSNIVNIDNATLTTGNAIYVSLDDENTQTTTKTMLKLEFHPMKVLLLQ